MFKNLLEGRAALSREPLLQQQLGLEQHHSSLLKLDVASGDKIAETWRLTAQTQAKEIASQSSLLKSPVLWFAVGLVTGAAGVVTAVVIARK